MNEQKEIENLYFNKKLSQREIRAIGYSNTVINKVLKGRRRSPSEAAKLSHERYSELFKHSNETKEKLRQIRLKYMKDHQGIPRWRESHKVMSYPEKLFANLLKKNKLAKRFDIVREYSIFPYYTDFAFLNIKLDVEVDGSQHWRSNNRKTNDLKRDNLLVEQGWRIYRIPEFRLKKEFEQVEKEFLDYLANIEAKPKQLYFNDEIIEYEKMRQYKKELEIKKKQQKKNEKLKVEIIRQKELVDKVLNSSIDFSSIGWVNEVSKIINTTKVKQWMKKWMLDFYNEKCFKRKEVKSSPNKERNKNISKSLKKRKELILQNRFELIKDIEVSKDNHHIIANIWNVSISSVKRIIKGKIFQEICGSRSID